MSSFGKHVKSIDKEICDLKKLLSHYKVIKNPSESVEATVTSLQMVIQEQSDFNEKLMNMISAVEQLPDNEEDDIVDKMVKTADVLLVEVKSYIEAAKACKKHNKV